MLDMTLAEFEQLVNVGEVVECTTLGAGRTKELTLVVEWSRPLHSWSSWMTLPRRSAS